MNQPLRFKDFETSQPVRWCPGCGDYAVLKAVQKTLASIGARPESTVFVSGIGCAARFPYYINAYGFHTIHGRAPAVATGLKLANPSLDVWVITGDGDGLSIGGNHLLHLLRRNVGVKVLLFNNEIYGLTKGQYSPTSRVGTHSPSTPKGSIDQPVSAGLFALGAGATFIGRGIDTDQKGLAELLAAAHAHRGTAFVEIFQNCIVYNDNVFEAFTDRKTAAQTQLRPVAGEPLVYGEGDRALALDPASLELVTVDPHAEPERVLRHQPDNPVLSRLLLQLEPPEHPMALGVLHQREAPVFEDQFHAAHPSGLKRTRSAQEAISDRDTWEVKSGDS